MKNYSLLLQLNFRMEFSKGTLILKKLNKMKMIMIIISQKNLAEEIN